MLEPSRSNKVKGESGSYLANESMGISHQAFKALSEFYDQKERAIDLRIHDTITNSLSKGLARVSLPDWAHCANAFCSPLLACAANPPRQGDIESIKLQRRHIKVTFSDASIQRVSYLPELKELVSVIVGHLQDSKAFQIEKSIRIARLLRQHDCIQVGNSQSPITEATSKQKIDTSEMLSNPSAEIAFILFDEKDAIALNRDGTKLWREKYSTSFQQTLDKVISRNSLPSISDEHHTYFGVPTDSQFNAYSRRICADIADMYAGAIDTRIPLSPTLIVKNAFNLSPLLHSPLPGGHFAELKMDELGGVMSALALGARTVNRLASKFAKRIDFSHLYKRDEQFRPKKEFNPFVDKILEERLGRLMNPHASSRFGLPGHHYDTLVFDLPLIEGLKANSEKYAKVALATFASNVFNHISEEHLEKLYQSLSQSGSNTLSTMSVNEKERTKSRLQPFFLICTLEYELSFQGFQPQRLSGKIVETLESIYRVPKEESIIQSFPDERLELSNIKLPKLGGPLGK